MRCIKLLIIPLLLISLSLSAQKKPLVSQEIKDYDYLSHKYEHLDENFKIHISSEMFDGFVAKYKFYPQRIKVYSDSLNVVLMGEFDNWHKCRIANLHITFSFKRIAYHLWITESEAKKLCEKYNIVHTYRFYEYMKQPERWDRSIKKRMLKLRKQVAKASNNSDVLSMSNKLFLKEAWRHSPERIKDFEKLHKERHAERAAKRRHQNPR